MRDEEDGTKDPKSNDPAPETARERRKRHHIAQQEIEKVLHAQQHLHELTDRDPKAAILAARELKSDHPNWLQVRAGTLCDAGFLAKDVSAIKEAVSLFEKIRGIIPGSGQTSYNLANALAALARVQSSKSPDWYLSTAEIRWRSRAMYGAAANKSHDNEPELASQVMTNLGNGLDVSHRWIEAYESYMEALALFPRNGVASGCAAEVLFRIASKKIIGHEPHILDVACRLSNHAKKNSDIVKRFAGPSAVKAFARLPSKDGKLVRADLRKDASKFEKFVAENRLLLSPVLEGLGHSPKRWDDAHIRSLIDPVGKGATVPSLFTMYNVMKSEYLAARDLLFQGIEGTPNETGFYLDTLDYAVYGTRPAQVVLAQRAALDVLDKIAVALNEYFGIGLKPNKVEFVSFWRQNPSEPKWRPELAKAIQEGNVALIALSEIAADLSEGADPSAPGLLHKEKKARKAGTHRFTVLHDLGYTWDNTRTSLAIEHHNQDDFHRLAVRTLRLVRAVLLHFLEVVAYAEKQRGKSPNRLGRMGVVPHHFIRGDDS